MCGPNAAFVTVPLCALVDWCCPLPTPRDSSEERQRHDAAPPHQIFALHPDFSREATRDAKQEPHWSGQTTPRKIGVMVLEIIYLTWNWGGSGTMSGLESYYFPFSPPPVSTQESRPNDDEKPEREFFTFTSDRPKNISFTPASHSFVTGPLLFTKARAFICSRPLSWLQCWAPAFCFFAIHLPTWCLVNESMN